MNKLYTLLFLCLTIFTVSCQQEEEVNEIGYLRFNLDTYVSVYPESRKIVDGYQPKRLTVQVINSNQQVVYHTDDYDNWKLKGKDLALVAGKYIIRAHSFGFDGKDSGFDIPYYAGETEAVIKAGERNIIKFTCTQANVKVTVNFDENFKKAFKKATSQITSNVSGVAPALFEMGKTSGSAYFPAGELKAKISVVNKADKEFSQTDVLAKAAKPRDHYILNYKLSDSGSNQIEVQTDDAMHIYKFTFKVATRPSTTLGMDLPSAWSNFALLKGRILSQKAGDEIDPQQMKFEYKAQNAGEWSLVDATLQRDEFIAKVTNLQPGSAYEARLVYKGTEALASEKITFTTETAIALPNSNLDEWYQSGNTWYAVSASDFKADHLFWDSSNPGTTTGAGALINKNPTQGTTSPVHTASGKSAELKSQYAAAFGIGKFAAASLYSGSFGELVKTEGAILNLGRPFTTRPTQLTGWFQYSTGEIDYYGPNTPDNAPKKGSQDLWSAYVVLTTGPIKLDNTIPSSFNDYNQLLADPSNKLVVAYGELSPSECKVSSVWEKFTINLKYKNLEMKPTHIIVVFSSSKYGDYFTGSTKSLLYLDDLELVYGNNPQVVGQ